MRRLALVLLLALLALAGFVGTRWLAPSSPEAGPAAPTAGGIPVQPSRADEGPLARPSLPVPAPRAAETGGDPLLEEHPPEGDVLELLEWLAARPGRGPLVGRVRDARGFEALLARENPERPVDARPHLGSIGAQLAEGVVLHFEPGAYRLTNVMPQGPFPRDVTFAGSGMDQTLLLLGGLRPRTSVRRLAIRDCTVYTENQPLFELRDAFASATFERVRFVGFDSGAVPSPLVRAGGLALLARQCFFEGGIGRAPGSGTLFAVPTAALLARFEGCRASFVDLGLAELDAGASAVFAHCTLQNLTADPAPELERHPGVVIEGGTLSVRSAERPFPVPTLEELFPRWLVRLKGGK
jgi:hypothetical protein